MREILLVLLAILPAVLLLYYFDHLDKGRKEPRKLLWKIFWWGIAATFAAAWLEGYVDLAVLKVVPNQASIAYFFLTAFVTAAIVEEGMKFWIVKRNVYQNKHFDEVMDGITYTIVASLGFATLENILYVTQYGFTVGLMRAVLSVPGHAMFSGIMGYYIGKSKFAKKKDRNKLLLIGFAFAVFYHGTFNFLLFTGSMWSFLVIPLVVVMAFHLRNRIKNAHYSDKVTKMMPKDFTLTRVVRIFFGSLLFMFGLTTIVGGIMLINSDNPTVNGEIVTYGSDHFIGSVAIAVFCFVAAYKLLKPRPRSAREKTT